MAHSAFHSLTLKELLESIQDYPEESVQLVEKAYHFAANAHDGQKRMSGDPYFVHPVFIASVLAEMQLDPPTIAAGLLHDTAEDCEGVTIEVIEKEFGEEVAVMVDGVTKIGRINVKNWEERQAESLRKMILAMGKDIRVILIKLADRLHNMLTLGYQPEEKQYRTAQETLEIYAPIAHRLGVYKIKQELEDLSLSYIDPEGYRDVATKVGAKRAERENQIQHIIDVLTEKITAAGIQDFEIAGRPKHLYSIYRKMVIQDKTFDQIYDLIAVRVLVNTLPECYQVLGIVHAVWPIMPDRFKDYISNPKNNMYQSLHTTLMGGREVKTPFEVQIRTHEMHAVAEYGIAAHWNYKEGKGGSQMDEKLYWLRQIIDWQSEARDAKEFIDGLKTDLFADEVFVFTPKGDIINMQKGATPLDFAYLIHSGVGNTCTGAKVNGRLVTLDYELQTGDRVEILTSKSAKGPSLDWLKVVKTSQAKAKIRQYFRKAMRSESVGLGKDMMEHEAKRRNVKLGDLTKPEYYEPLLRRYSLADLEAIYGAVGFGGMTAVHAVGQLIDEQQRQKDKEQKKTPPQLPQLTPTFKPQGKPTQGVYVAGGPGMLVRFAHCCNPVPGDEINGYVTRGRGVTVHKADCINILNSEPERRIEVAWADEGSGTFMAGLRIIAYDRPGLVGELTGHVGDSGIKVNSLSAKANKNGTAVIQMSVEVSGTEQLQQLLNRMKRRSDVLEAYRTGN
ncbi:MAG TPA: bifunctional (p)ppGpp synthetase/guanosine-3',5'-bis(diphosphate) 3'-pyrophosphohydrolase [Clostridiales bacterium]|jgi:GTP pyrophosphokinase|nr:bifunctional (p)ppGpp synthetase/guanosine-3',5'-bis(diphosphate) 3'-pyrophosphohydrolase [Clostridiales bacterium]